MCALVCMCHFNPRSPQGGATLGQQPLSSQHAISIHAPRKGERRSGRAPVSMAAHYFNPRSPQGGATEDIQRLRTEGIFQSTLPARGSDVIPSPQSRPRWRFQSTLPARGSDLTAATPGQIIKVFQSTLPARGSDSLVLADACSNLDFNPRSPQGGATPPKPVLLPYPLISIHAPRKGERPGGVAGSALGDKFQSTLPARGSDHSSASFSHACTGFQSTLPARGSDTRPAGYLRGGRCISIHAPRKGERQSALNSKRRVRREFQSTLPARGSDAASKAGVPIGIEFQSTLPARGSDWW